MEKVGGDFAVLNGFVDIYEAYCFLGEENCNPRKLLFFITNICISIKLKFFQIKAYTVLGLSVLLLA